MSDLGWSARKISNISDSSLGDYYEDHPIPAQKKTRPRFDKQNIAQKLAPMRNIVWKQIENQAPELDDVLAKIDCHVSRSFVQELHELAGKPLNRFGLHRTVKHSLDLDSLIVTFRNFDAGQPSNCLVDTNGVGLHRRSNSHESILSEIDDESLALHSPSLVRTRPQAEIRPRRRNRPQMNDQRTNSGIFEYESSAERDQKMMRWKKYKEPQNMKRQMRWKTQQKSFDNSVSDYHSASYSNSFKTTDLENMMEDLRLKIDLNDFTVDNPISGNAILSQPISVCWAAPLLDERSRNSNQRAVFSKTKKPLLVIGDGDDDEANKQVDQEKIAHN